MKAQVGPASKELRSVEVAEDFLRAPEVSVVYFGSEDSKLKGKQVIGGEPVDIALLFVSLEKTVIMNTVCDKVIHF